MRRGQQPELEGRALDRPVAVQGADAVHQVQGARQGAVDVQDHGPEPLRAVPHPVVGQGLAEADHAAEQVLDRAGQGHLAVDLELGQVQDAVRLEGVA